MRQDIHPVTIAITNDAGALETAARVAERFKRLNGVKPQVITKADVGEVAKGFFLPLSIWDLVPEDVETILYYDWNLVPMRPFEDVDFGRFAMVPDTVGLFAARRDTKSAFETLRDLYFSGDLKDMSVKIAYESLALDDYVRLPETWNYPVRHAQRLIMNPRMLSFIGHTECMPRRWRLLSGTLDVFDAAEEQHASEVAGQEQPSSG